MAEDSDLDDFSMLTDDLPPHFKEEITPPTAETAAQAASLLTQAIPPATQLHLQLLESPTPAKDTSGMGQNGSTSASDGKLDNEPAGTTEAKPLGEKSLNLPSISGGITKMDDPLPPESHPSDQERIDCSSSESSTDEEAPHGTQHTDEDDTDEESLEEEATAKRGVGELSQEMPSPVTVQKSDSFSSKARESPAIREDSPDIAECREKDPVSGHEDDTDEDDTDEESLEEEATAKRGVEELSQEMPIPVAVQKSNSRHVVISFSSKARESPAIREDSPDIAECREKDPVSGHTSVMERIHFFEGAGTDPSADAPAVTHTADPGHASVGLEGTTTVSATSTPQCQPSKDDEEIANRDKAGSFSEDGISSQLKSSGSYGGNVQEVFVQESSTPNTPVKKQYAEQKEEVEEDFSIIPSSDNEDRFCTPSNSPDFNQPAPSPPLEMLPQDVEHQHDGRQQGYGQGAPAQHGDWDSATRPSPVQQSHPLSGQSLRPQDVHLSGVAEYPRMMSPQPMRDTEWSQNMQGVSNSSAFRPVPQRPQHWGSQQDMSGYGSFQYLSPQQQQQQRFSPGPHPGPQQYWQGNPQVASQQAYHPMMHQQQLWQQQQQQQQQQQRQKHPKEPGHTPGSKDPVHFSAAPQGGERVVTPDSGYTTPHTPAVAGHPGYVTPQTPASTGNPGYITPQTPASTGHPGYVTPQTPASTGHPDISQGQAQQKAGGSHPAPTSPVQGAVGSDQDAPAPSTIRVDGVNMDMDLELLEFYFESPKKSAGDQITNIVDHRSQGYVLVTFEDPDVVQRVMQHSHKVSNKPLTVSLYQEHKEELAEETVGNDQDAPAPSTIRVDGVNMDMDLELLEFYFESPKKSGGDQITNIADYRSQGYILVTFEDPAVVQRVMQQSHKVSKKSLTVSLYLEPKEEPAEDFSCTVEVTGGSIALNKEMMEFYFENTKKSGGGKTTKIEVMEEAGVTLITFEEKRAAEEVVKRPHTVSNTSLRVVPYKPPGPPTKVKVSGLTPKATDELLLLYFEKAGDVEEVKLDSEKGEAVVTFADPAAVQTVLKQNHKINGKPVTVSLLTTSRSSTKAEGSDLATPETCSVEVKGLGADTNEDTIQLYFENTRRSGGGPVEEFKYKQGSGVAIITFKEAEAAKRVLEKDHVIDNKPLKVCLYSRSASPDASPPSEPQELTMVRVQGLSISTSTDTLLNYFENYRRSGGGDVVEVTLDSKTRTFFVTFENPEDAARVTSRPHQLQGKQLEVCLYEPPKMCRDRLVLRNLPEVRTRDELWDFVEVKSKLTVDTILFGEEEGTAVVIFETDVDRQQVQAALTKKPFKGCSLTVDSIPESSTVLVSNLPQNPPVSEDLLTNYFENKRHSDGGEVTNVELGSNAEYALVTFADMEVAARVAGRSHKLQGCPVGVGIYMECLGLGGGSEEPTTRIPNPLPVSAADCQKLSLLRKLPKLMEAFVASLDNSHAHLELNDVSGSATIACTLRQEMESVRQMAKSWEEDVAHVLQDHLQTVFAEQLKVTVEEFTEAEDSIKKLIADMSEVAISYSAEQNLLLIVYKGEQPKDLVSTLVTKIKDTQEELDRKKREKTDTVKNSQGKLLLLQKHKVMKNLSEKYPHLVITFRGDEGLLELKGLEQEIQGAKIKILETLNDFKSATHKWDTELYMELLENDEARKTVESLCSEQLSPDDVLMFTRHGFEVHSFDAQRAEMIQVTAVKAVQKRVIKFNDDSKLVLMTQEWRDLKRSILTCNEGLMLMDEDESSLTIVSVSQSIQSDYRSLQDFLQENSVKQHTFPLPQCMHELFRPFLQERVIPLNLRMEDFDFDQDCNQVTISGNKLCIEAAQGIYSSFREMLTVKRKTFTQPSMKEFFRKQEWARKREEIERELKCLVLDPAELPEDFMGFEDAGATGASPFLGHWHDQLPTEEDIFMTSQLGLMPEEPGHGNAWKPEADGRLGRHGFTRTRPKRDTAARSTNQPKPDLPARPRLYLSAMSDITKEEHHVLISSIDTTLDMSQGQVAKALLEVGGAEIQQELKETYPNGIKMGDIAVSGGGKLICKKLFHCCLPEEKDEEKIQAVVRDAVMKCMAQADQLQMGSIGFPSLGTGNLGYPATQVAHTMLEAALDYGRQHPDTVISDVFFILHKKDTNLTQVFREEHDKYKQMLRDSQRTKEEEESYLTPVNPSSQGVESYPYFEETRGSVVKVLVGMGQTAVDKAETDLLAAYNNSISTISHDVEHLDQWSDLDKEDIKNGCKVQCIDLTLNFSLSRLQLRGFKDSLGRIPLHQTLKDAEASVSKRQNAALLLQQVQWSCIEVDEDGEHLVPYDMLSNYDIEMAYQDGREKVIVVDSDRVASVINFSMMDERPEIPDKDIDPIRVIRQVKIKSLDIQPPKGWTDMKGQDLDVVPLQPSSTEHSSVADIFMNSLGMPNVQIVKIERIQNLTLYKQYQAMKQQMEDTMPNDRHCERTHLWHGTKSEAVDGINKYGFNRSYSDLKKCAYGQGVYFAASAEYSSRNEYAVAHPLSKERNMFMCNVLVGQYTKGDQGMRMPPEISPGRMRYNSTVDDPKDPQIFVTYSDVQAFPEYRIVFKDG